MIGKRKRELAVTHREQSTKIAPSNDAGSDVFRSYFEARFQPLPESIHSTAKSAEVDVEDGTDTSEQSEGSTWEGLSDEDLSTIVDVIDHGSQDVSADAPERSFEFKSFMTSRPPREISNTVRPKLSSNSKDDDGETMNLKHDVDLQRLLTESRLLERTKTPSGAGHRRHRVTDLHLQGLGAKESLFAQQKMPMSHRKGIATKAAVREALRRREAKENGVILEKATQSSRVSKRRTRGVDGPTVGKFHHGMLKLSQRDVININNSGQSPRRGRMNKR